MYTSNITVMLNLNVKVNFTDGHTSETQTNLASHDANNLLYYDHILKLCARSYFGCHILLHDHNIRQQIMIFL